MDNIAVMLEKIKVANRLSHSEIARLLGTSLVSVHRWLKGTARPSPAMLLRIEAYYNSVDGIAEKNGHFAGYGINKSLPLFESLLPNVKLTKNTLPPILSRISDGNFIGLTGSEDLRSALVRHHLPAKMASSPPVMGMSAGKNTYTYDAHTYHTKVPPQGIAELLNHYLPDGGLVLDPFAGSGMTGVAARTLGYDCILNELSPAAAFIANQFNAYIAPDLFESGIKAILQETQQVRNFLYSTTCRECGKPTELQYVVWSYHVVCPNCDNEFQLWDYCRSYGATVREHKILKTIECPSCKSLLRKSSLERKTPCPVLIGYKCCRSRQQEVTHIPNQEDIDLIQSISQRPLIIDGFTPRYRLYDGVNLRQPINHGLDSVDKFYTARNLSAMSHLWTAIHRVENEELGAFLAFVFTSLYQRVTKLSEFRFWGGSGNTARFNVPYIFNEANVFLTFIRKAKSISDHLRTTAQAYQGSTIVINGSATSLADIPNESIDLVFTDPPFGANINYSEMNILWEAWLGKFTNTKDEAIVNKFQNKDVHAYETLMTKSIGECYRVLRSRGWMLIMFMNTSKDVWEALRKAISSAGFSVEKIDLFDKQHGTFKQFVNENAAGFDLVIHCRKNPREHQESRIQSPEEVKKSITKYIKSKDNSIPYISYVHVQRSNEIDYRQLYSEWLAIAMLNDMTTIDFPLFRAMVSEIISLGE